MSMPSPLRRHRRPCPAGVATSTLVTDPHPGASSGERELHRSARSPC